MIVAATAEEESEHDAKHAQGQMYEVVQDGLVGMAVPLLFVLGAPITLFLGSVRPSTGRFAMGLLRTRSAWVLTRPSVVLVLAVGPMGALYFTPLYGWATASAPSHVLLHAHFLAAGYLFAWVIAGPDPAPHRASVKARIVTIGVAVVIHAAMSQFMYAGIGVHVDAPAEQIRDGASLMYFGGDLIEILLALALLASWRTSQRPPTTSRVKIPAGTVTRHSAGRGEPLPHPVPG